MNIYVRVTNNFGNRAIYPACGVSRLLADLAGTKTFTPSAIELIKALGYTFNIKHEEI